MTDKLGKQIPLHLQDDPVDTDEVGRAKSLMRSSKLLVPDSNLLDAVFKDRDIWININNESIETFENVEKVLIDHLDGPSSEFVALHMVRGHLFDLRAAMGHIAMYKTPEGFNCVNLDNVAEYYDPKFDWGKLNDGAYELALNILNAYAPVFDDQEAEDDEAEYEEFAGFSIRSAILRSHKQFAIDVVAKVPEHGGVITADEIHRFLLDHGIRPEQLDSPPKNCRYWG